MKVLGKIRLAPGEVGFYDELTRIHLTIANPERHVLAGMNTTNIKRAVRSGRLLLASGSLDLEAAAGKVKASVDAGNIKKAEEAKAKAEAEAKAKEEADAKAKDEAEAKAKEEAEAKAKAEAEAKAKAEEEAKAAAEAEKAEVSEKKAPAKKAPNKKASAKKEEDSEE